MILFIIGALLFVGLVLVHEWGHAVAARRNGVTVEEFGLGFPPRARSLGKRNGTEYTVARDTKIVRDYDNKDVIGEDQVLPGTPAEKAGLKPDDQIVSIAGTAIKTTENLSATTKAHAGQSVSVVVKRGNDTSTKQITLNKTSPNLGVSSYSAATGIQLRRNTWSAPIVAAGVTKDFTVATFQGLGNALKGLGSLIAGGVTGNKAARQTGQTQASSQVAGPIGIVQTLYEGSKLGVGFMLFIIAVISLTLAIMNVLPIPALDGGRLYTMLAFRAAKKKLTQNTEEKIQMTGMGLLMTLILLVTIVDVQRFIR